jgi:small-conductance mechanosensitive channel
LANLYGRSNLSKTCFTTGFFNVVLAVSFFWSLRLLNQGFSLASKAYSVPGKKLFKINFDRAGDKAPPLFFVFLFVGWFILFARNFYMFTLIAEPIKNFIVEKRTIGEFSFTVGSIFKFFFILYLAGMTSRMVSFFATSTPAEFNSNNRKGGIGSWLLIIRIAIVSIGLLLAFAAIGVPMDRLTIILSALSVGVGFGLQSLVNNLVSGLIISFEKPVSVGDIVDVGGQYGTIKSIGFRSSIIVTPLGSQVVIPNGELLSQHLINWTHDNNFRRVDVTLGVAYGTNLEKAIQILKELPAKDQRVLSNPPVNVIVTQFNSSSIDMRLSFWVRDIREWLSVQSDIILLIDNAFKENKIEIPLPQQDIRIRSISQEQVDGKNEVEKTL